jgi:2-hydroxychromene-2-carboxylate isomerase
MPEEFPKASLSCARAFYALVDEQSQQAKALAKAMFHEIFALGRDGTQPQSIAASAKQIGIDADALLEAIQTPEIKQRLKHETDAAIERGIFGSPFFYVDQQPFWGNDRLEQLDRWLETGGW